MRTPDDREGRRFMVRTQHSNLEISDQQRGVEAPAIFRYENDGTQGICLRDEIDQLPQTGVVKAIEERKSVRSYAQTPISMSELSLLLRCTAGVRKIGKIHTMRNVPSAGARHAIDTAIYVNKVTDIAPGLYGYAPKDHTLVPHATPGDTEGPNDSSSSSDERIGNETAGSLIDINSICTACFNQTFILDAAVVFIWIATPYRMNWRYGVRGYRYLHLDAGHICQNLYLAAEGIGSGVCAIAAYDDEQLNALMGLNGTDEFVIYVAAVGKKTGN